LRFPDTPPYKRAWVGTWEIITDGGGCAGGICGRCKHGDAADTVSRMNHFHYTALFAVAGLLLVVAVAFAAEPAAKSDSPGSDAKGGELLHVVSLKFKPGATPEQIGLVEKSFEGLKQKIPGVKSLKWGTNVSPEKHDKGFTHCFVLTFANEKDRDAYLVHEDHKAFGAVLKPVMEDVFVLDFWAKQ
jgi:hypothetical protein